MIYEKKGISDNLGTSNSPLYFICLFVKFFIVWVTFSKFKFRLQRQSKETIKEFCIFITRQSRKS